MRAGVLVATVAASLAVAGAARAVEHEHQIGLEAGMPILVVNGASSHVLTGAGAGVHYTYGLTDAFNLIADGGSSFLFTGGSGTVSNVDVGLAYVLVVLTWVPWAGIEAGGYALTGDASGTAFFPGAAIALGVDYRFTRSWAAGIELRQHLLLTSFSNNRDFSSGGITLPSFSQALLRVGYTWGW